MKIYELNKFSIPEIHQKLIINCGTLFFIPTIIYGPQNQWEEGGMVGKRTKVKNDAHWLLAYLIYWCFAR